jgi:hypothetical protein
MSLAATEKEMCACLRDHVEVPEHRVGVVLLGGVEPEVDPLLAVARAAGEHVGLQDVGLPRPVAQELEVDLVVLRVLRRQLHRSRSRQNSTSQVGLLHEA